MRGSGVAIVAVIGLAVTGCTTHLASHSAPETDPISVSDRSTVASHEAVGPISSTIGADVMPKMAHIVVIVMENRGYAAVVGNASAPFINSLYRQGLSLTQMYGVTHPSQPNYLALFSGSTQRVTSDACPQRFAGANLASTLVAAGYTFAGYSEALPNAGYTGCQAGGYARKHNPWVDFSNVPASINRPFSAFPARFDQLPTVSFVVPDLEHDMHDGTVAQGDSWLATHLAAYANWAPKHDSLLIITWDEADGSGPNRIPTLIVGSDLVPGTDGQPANQYTLLRTIEDAYGLAHLGNTAAATPLTGTWQP